MLRAERRKENRWRLQEVVLAATGPVLLEQQ